MCPVDAIASSCPEERDAYVCHARAPDTKSWICRGPRIVPEVRFTPHAWMHEEDHGVQA
jgi:hypothetical protein